MSEKNTGGPAFPRVLSTIVDPSGDQMHTGTFGMDLRDYFAAKAMREMNWAGYGNFIDRSAAACYAIADAMLRARSA